MLSINFGIYTDQNEYGTAVSEKKLMDSLANDPVFREELLRNNHRGNYGNLEIRFYKHSLIVPTDTVWGLLFAVHLQAIKAIKKGATFRNYLENAAGEYMTFDYIDARTTGVRIRYYGIMRYEDDHENDVFVSRTDYLKQEIIVPKDQYLFEMQKCIARFIEYRELLACNDPEDYFLQDFKNELEGLQRF